MTDTVSLWRTANEVERDRVIGHITALLKNFSAHLFTGKPVFRRAGDGDYRMIDLGAFSSFRFYDSQVRTRLFVGRHAENGLARLFEDGPPQTTPERLEQNHLVSMVLRPRPLSLEGLPNNELSLVWHRLQRASRGIRIEESNAS